MLRYVALDLETTGLNANSDAIIEIGLVKFSFDGEIARYSSLISYSQKLPMNISRITGIKDSDLAGSPDWSEVKEKVENFIEKGDILVGHNIDFDLAFLKKAGVDVEQWQKVDTWELASMFIFNINSYSLEHLAKYIQLEYDAHRALNDALAVEYLLKHIYQIVGGFSNKTKSMIGKIVDSSDLVIKAVLVEMMAQQSPKIKKNFYCRNENKITSNAQDCVTSKLCLSEKSYDEFMKSIADNGDICLFSDRVLNYFQKSNNYNVFDKRSEYICRGSLSKFGLKKSWSDTEAKVMIKILARIEYGYWDGNFKQIFWGENEWEELDQYRCDGIWCNRDCFFDRRLKNAILNRKSIFVSKDFLLENNFSDYSNLKCWGEKLLVEDTMTDIFSSEIKFDWWRRMIENWLSKTNSVSESKLLTELNAKILILEGLIRIFVKSKGVLTDYGWISDVSLMLKMDQSYQVIREKIFNVLELVKEIKQKYPKLNLELLFNLLNEVLDDEKIVQMYLDKRNHSVIKYVNLIFTDKLWQKYSNVELSSRVVGIESDVYPGIIFGKHYQKELKKYSNIQIFDWTQNKSKLDILEMKGYNLSVFSSRNKLEQFADLLPFDKKEIFQVKDLKKRGKEVFTSGWLLATYYDLNEWTLFTEKFDCIYLDSLFFDVPGELVSSWRQMQFSENSFDHYIVTRMVGRFKFVVSLLKENGKLLIGDERFFTKSYGKRIRKLFDL